MFTPALERILVIAAQGAQDRRHAHLTTEHVLLFFGPRSENELFHGFCSALREGLVHPDGESRRPAL